MDFHDVYLVSDRKDCATDAEVAATMQALGTRFPTGYRDYVTTLGMGQLNDKIRIFMPSEIVVKTEEFRENEVYLAARLDQDDINRWDLFDAGLDLLPPERFVTSVLLGEAADSNRIVFHPDAPDSIFLIDDTEIFSIGRSVEEAIRWFLEDEPYGRKWRVLTTNGRFVDRSLWYFEPDRDRERFTFNLKEEVAFDEVRARLLTLALQRLGEALFVSEVYLDEEVEHEIVHFFTKEYGGAVRCNDIRSDHEGIAIRLSYDRSSHAASLNQIIDFCRDRALRFGDDNGSDVLL